MAKIIKNPWVLLIVVLIIAAFLRFYDIAKTPPGFYPDEAINANNGVEAWETGHFQVFYPENNGREGLWMNIVGFFVFKFGHEPWIPRAVAAAFGLLTVLGVYFLTKELFKENSEPQILNSKQIQNSKRFRISRSQKIALLSSFFLATSFWHINFSRISFRAIMAPFFLVWAIYFLLLALRKAKDRKSSIFYLLSSIFSGLFYGLGLHTYIAYRVTPLLILIILFFCWFQNKEKAIRRRILLSTFCFLLSTIIVALPLGLYFLKNPQDFLGRTAQISIFSAESGNSLLILKNLAVNILKTAGMFNFAGDNNWRHNYAGRPELFWPVGILFLLGIFLGIKSIFKKTRIMEFAILFSWFALTALPVVVSNEGLPHALRAILMIPPIFVLAGIGGIWLYEQFMKLRIFTNIRIKIILLAICCLLLSLLIFEAYATYFVLWGKNSNTAGAFSANYVEIGRQLNALPKETPKYVIVKAQGALVRGIPMPAQTVMFITDTFTPEKQKEKNIFYLLPEQTNQIPENGYVIILE